MSSSTALAELFRSTLEINSCQRVNDPMAVIRGLAFLHNSMVAASMANISLSAEEAGELRSLFVQCLHGGTPESVRDEAITCLLQFLTVWNLLHRSWTIDERTCADSGQFATLITSALSVEFYLLLNEAVAFTERIDSIEIAQSSRRRSRCLTMLEHCFRLQDSLLSCLIPFHDEEIAVWENLPSRSILQIRQNMHNCVSESLDFIRTAATVMIEPIDSGVGVSEFHRPLLSVVERAVMSVGLWVVEDSDLHDPLMKHLQALANCSHACSLAALLTTSTAGISPIARIVLGAGAQEVIPGNATFSVIDKALWQYLLSTESDNDSSDFEVFGDVLQLLLPSLLALDLDDDEVIDTILGTKSLIAGLFLLAACLLPRCEGPGYNLAASQAIAVRRTLDMTSELLSKLLIKKRCSLRALGIGGGEGAHAIESIAGVSVPAILVIELSTQLTTLKDTLKPEFAELRELLLDFVR